MPGAIERVAQRVSIGSPTLVLPHVFCDNHMHMDDKTIRQWARTNAISVPERGPIPKSVRARYAARRASAETDRVVIYFRGQQVRIAKKYLLEAVEKTIADELAEVQEQLSNEHLSV
jgi:hypothetical protein